LDEILGGASKLLDLGGTRQPRLLPTTADISQSLVHPRFFTAFQRHGPLGKIGDP
jgi:hypothetical protein